MESSLQSEDCLPFEDHFYSVVITEEKNDTIFYRENIFTKELSTPDNFIKFMLSCNGSIFNVHIVKEIHNNTVGVCPMPVQRHSIFSQFDKVTY